VDAEILGADVKGRFADLKQAAADRCPRELGTFVKGSEVQYHHEVYNQSLWNGARRDAHAGWRHPPALPSAGGDARRLPHEELQRRKQSADLSFLTQGITFTVYGRDEGTERIFPYDLLPRLITAAEWDRIERGLTQRITALNHFLRDVYNEGKILNDRVVPREMVYSCKHLPPPDARPAGAAQRLHRRRRHRPAAAETASSSCSKTICACLPA
jgi:hypothetical protein